MDFLDEFWAHHDVLTLLPGRGFQGFQVAGQLVTHGMGYRFETA